MKYLQKYNNVLIVAVILLLLTLAISPALALIFGIAFSVLGIKSSIISKLTPYALQLSIVLMGFGMNLEQVISISKEGFLDTAISVVFVMTTGYFLGRLLKIDFNTSMLISSGTAICGGSAIAAVSPVLGAKNNQISFALIVIFVLNAIALIIFPPIGHFFDMSQEAFGYWAAIAIHDTSSVVGAGASYGKEALETATTVKLIRALWIIPLSISIAFFKKGSNSEKIKLPYFIAFFIVAICISYYFPEFKNTYNTLSNFGSKGMIIALFLIGSGIHIKEIKKAGPKSFILGISLWLLIGISSLASILLLK